MIAVTIYTNRASNDIIKIHKSNIAIYIYTGKLDSENLNRVW